MADQFAKKFGTRWLRTPVAGVYYIGIPGHQFSICENEVAYFTFATVGEFKTAFEEADGYPVDVAGYFSLDPKNKWSYLDVVAYLRKRGIDILS